MTFEEFVELHKLVEPDYSLAELAWMASETHCAKKCIEIIEKLTDNCSFDIVNEKSDDITKQILKEFIDGDE